MATLAETQGASTEINFYEGGTGHNRFWNSGSARFGGAESNLCSQLTSDVDCDTSGTGADVVVEDDIWLGGDNYVEGNVIVGSSAIILQSDGGATFNEQSGAVDFRVETDDNANTLFVDGANDAVLIGSATYASANIVLNGSGEATFNNSIEIPNGTAPTVDSVGEIAVDTTDDQFVYYGSAKRVLPYEREACVTIENLAAADDDSYFFTPQDNITLVKGIAHCSGTCTTEADFVIEHREVGTASTVNTVTGTIDAEDEVTGDTYTTLSTNNAVTGGDIVRFDVTNAVSPETDTYNLCVVFTVDAQ